MIFSIVGICDKRFRLRLKIHDISRDPTVQVKVLDLESNTQDPIETSDVVAEKIDFGNFIITSTSFVTSKLEFRERSRVAKVLEIILQFPLILIGNFEPETGILYSLKSKNTYNSSI